MKYALLLCFVFLFGGGLQAQETVIPLKWYEFSGEEGRAPLKDRIKDRRSLTLAPYATYDGSTLFIYAEMVLKDMVITVEDSTGNVWHSETVCIPVGGCHSFVLSEDILAGETLRLVLDTEMGIYEGAFAL